MIEFKPITTECRELYESYLMDGIERGCEYSFVNLYLWGRQRATILHDHLTIFSQFNRRSIYPYPVGPGEKKPVLDAIIADSKERAITCRISGITGGQKETMEALYPGMFRFHCDRDGYNYVYDINDLADLKGKKYQRKRNHYYRFRDACPNYVVEPIGEDNIEAVSRMVDQWYEIREQENPESDYHLERTALTKALRDYQALKMEGLVLLNEGEVLAMTMGSRISANTFDVHFEKARADMDKAYTAINYEFARHIRGKYPEIQYLNREEDMGLEGLRKAKESYHPHHMVEKYWAILLEDGYDY